MRNVFLLGTKHDYKESSSSFYTAEKSKATDGLWSAACLLTDRIAVSGLSSKNNRLCDFKNSISASVRIKSAQKLSVHIVF